MNVWIEGSLVVADGTQAIYGPFRSEAKALAFQSFIEDDSTMADTDVTLHQMLSLS